MESTCSERYLSASSDETECHPYPKRIKIESTQKIIQKEEQQKLEQSVHCVNTSTSPHEPLYSSERQTSWALEKQICDTARKICMREFFHFDTCSSEKLPCGVSDNKLSTKKWSPENENQVSMEDGVSLNVHGQSLETELLSVCSAAPQLQQNNNIERNNKRTGENELKQNSSVTPLKRDLFQMEMLSHKSVSDKKWKQYQLLQIPFLCSTNSVFSHIEHEKNNFLKKVCTTEDKDYSNSDETTAERDNKGKKNSSYIFPTLKPFRRIPPLEIPNFQFPSISNKINSKMPSTNLKKMDWKNFKGQPSLMQSKQIHGVQKMSEIGQQKPQNDKSIVKVSTVGSEFKVKNCQSISKQEYSALAGGRKVPVTYFRDNSTDIECNQRFAKNCFKDKMLENSDGEDDQKSRIHIYISAKNVQKEKCVSSNDLLKKMGRKSSNENAETFHIQTTFPVITEALEENKLVMHCDVRNSNSDISLHESESKLSTKEVPDFKRYLTKNVIFESHCLHIVAQNFPDTKVSFNLFRGKEKFKLKFSFHNMLFGRVRTRTESLCEDTPTCQDDGIAHWFHFHETLNEQCDTQELVKSNINRSHINKICVCLLAIISRHLKMEVLKSVLASFFSSRDTLLPAEGKYMQVENHPGRKQVQLNPCADNTLRQNTEFHKENETYPGFVSFKFVESIGFGLHTERQRIHFSRSLGEEASTFLKRGTFFHNQKSGLCKGRHVRKHYLLSRGLEGFSTYLRSVSHKNSTKKQNLVAKCLILLQGTFACSSLDKMYCCSIPKVQYLIGASLRFWSYFPAHSQLNFEKGNSKCTNQEILVTTVKQEKKKPNKMFNSSLHGERFKAFPFILFENKNQETTGCRECIKSTNEVTNKVTYTMKKYLGTSSYIYGDRKESVKSKELQINSHNFISKKYFSIFDTYEKIPLTTDSEDFDQIPVVNQVNSVQKKLYEENAVKSSKEDNSLTAESNDVLTLPETSKTTMENINYLLLQDSKPNNPKYCKKLDTCSPGVADETEDQNTYLNIENVFPSSSNVYQSDTLPSDSSSAVNEVGGISEDGHCRSSSSTDKPKRSDKTHATTPRSSTGSPTRADMDLQLENKGTVQFSSQGHTQTNKAVSSEPATSKKHLEYVKEQEEISDDQMHVTNESQCETLMNDSIISYSEDESKSLIAAEEELKMPLSVMNNRYLEDVKDKYLPLENKITYEFELKRKFDLVLEELHMFHEISKGNESNLSSLETNSHDNYCELDNSEGIDDNVTSVSQKKICISSPICGTIEGQNITVSNEKSLNEKISNENEEQRISKEYCISPLSSEELLHSPTAEGYFDAACKKPYTWDPAFLSCTLLKEQNYHLQKEGGYFLSHEVIRVQPLKTCKGPIRIGLSRKARPKQLHPYLK